MVTVRRSDGHRRAVGVVTSEPGKEKTVVALPARKVRKRHPIQLKRGEYR